MLADIAHELRSPLGTMQGKLEGLLDGVLPLEQQHVATVYDQTLLLSRLVDDLRLLSLARAGELPLEPAPTGVVQLVQQVADELQPWAQERSVALDTEVPDHPVVLTIDAHWWKRMAETSESGVS